MATSRFISIFSRTLASVLCLLIAIAIYMTLVMSKPKLEVVSGLNSLPSVIVMEAVMVPVARRTIGYGTASSLLHADVPALISSTVVTLPPTTRVGRAVRKGDLLIELDDVDFHQQVIRAELAIESSKSDQMLLAVERDAAEQRAQLAVHDKELAEAELMRIQKAFELGAAKQREVDFVIQSRNTASALAVNATEMADKFPIREEQASSTIATKKAELVLAEENLRRCTVLSPIDGVIQQVDVRVGEHVSSGMRIARVVNSAQVEIPLRLPSFARSFINLFDPVSLRSAGFGKRNWMAQVSRIAPEDDSNTRTMVVYVDVDQMPSNETRIPPGLFLRGEVVNLSGEVPRWVVPRRSLRDDQVLLVRDSIVRSIPVIVDYSITGAIESLGLPDYDWAILETPLRKGDLVVVNPGGTLRDGMNVRTILASEAYVE